MKAHSLMDKKMENLLSISLTTEQDMKVHTLMDIEKVLEQFTITRAQ